MSERAPPVSSFASRAMHSHSVSSGLAEPPRSPYFVSLPRFSFVTSARPSLVTGRTKAETKPVAEGSMEVNIA
eukprot:2514639-Prymnesium_polylepis.1